MKAPEKLYVNIHDHLTQKGYYAFTNKVTEDDIEYVRKDAFIEKACSYIRLYSALIDTENNDCMPEWLDKFRNAMEK